MQHLELNLPNIFNAADYFIDRHIREGRGNKLAVLCEDRSLTYSDFTGGVLKCNFSTSEIRLLIPGGVLKLHFSTPDEYIETEK